MNNTTFYQIIKLSSFQNWFNDSIRVFLCPNLVQCLKLFQFEKLIWDWNFGWKKWILIFFEHGIQYAAYSDLLFFDRNSYWILLFNSLQSWLDSFGHSPVLIQLLLSCWANETARSKCDDLWSKSDFCISCKMRKFFSCNLQVYSNCF